MRRLQAPWDRPETAEGGDHLVQPRDHVVFRSARHQRERQVVETAFHVERRRQAAAVHPEDAETRIVRHQLPRADAVDVLRRQRDAHDLEVAPPAVDDRADAIARTEVTADGEGFADQDLVRILERRETAAPEEEIVQHRRRRNGNADQASAGGFRQVGHVERHVHDDAGVHAGDAGDLGHAVLQVERRAREPGKHVREPVALVIGRLGVPERRERAQVHDEHRDAGADHQADRKRLTLECPEVAQQLPIEGPNHHKHVLRATC